MQEIKYRVWCNNKKEWEKDTWHLTPDGKIVDTRRNVEMKKETHFLNQFTGLFDKQGVEIYEGDLLKIEMDWGYGLAEIIIKVYFENGSFRAKALNSHEDTILLELPYLEVVGNIYENEELLS